MSEYAIEINGVGKKFYIGEVKNRSATLKSRLQSIILNPFTRFSTMLSGKAPTHMDKELWALRNIDLKVKPGESIGIIGRNGSGKSTLLQLVSNVMVPTEGEVITRGHIVAMLNIGTGFHPELTGRENVYINAAILGLTSKEIDAIYDQIVDFAEIGEFMNTPLKRYSSGMRVRLAFAVAINVQPEIIILDEVLAVGDPMFREKCIQAVLTRYKDTTIMIVSHNVHYLKRICDRIVWLHDGEIFKQGDPADVISSYLSLVDKFKLKKPSQPKEDGSMFDIQEVSLIQPLSGEVRYSINSDVGMLIRLKYDVLKSLDRLRVTCRFVHRDTDTIVFSCSDSDVEPLHLQLRPAGSYIAEFQTPEMMLAPNDYYLTIIFDDPENHYVYDTWEKIIEFRVVDTRSKRTEWFKESKAGYINYDLPWDYTEWGNKSGSSTKISVEHIK